MIIYHRERPFPRCKYCGEQMDYWVPGLKDIEHSHSECAGKAAANEIIDRVKNDIQ